jgi:hypothetical protein
MTRYLHTLSAILFYILGGSFFLAYILKINAIAVAPSLLWLQKGILPLLCISLLYGGTSIYLSVTNELKPSRTLAITIAIPLIIVFIIFMILKFSQAA